MKQVVRVVVVGLVATLAHLVPGSAVAAHAQRPLVCVGTGARLPQATCSRSAAVLAVPENKPRGTVLGTIGFSGLAHARLRLVEGRGGSDNAAFALVRQRSVTRLVTRRVLDREEKATYSVRIRARADGRKAERVVRIRVLDRNDTPTGLVLSSARVAGGSPAGTVVGRLHATDQDGDRLTYRVTEGPFRTVGEELRAVSVLDGSSPRVPLTVVASDPRGGRTSLRTTVNVTPAPPSGRPELHLSAAAVAEDATTGVAVGTLTLTAPHVTGTPTFALVAGAGDTDNASVSVDDDVLRVATALDHETAPVLHVRVRGTDEADIDVVAELEIAVGDVNETPADLTVTGLSVAENRASGTVVGAVAATDPDAGDTLTYSVDDARFVIADGELRTAAVLDHETDPAIDVSVTATDAGGLATSETVTVTVVDVDEAPSAVGLDASQVAENAPADTAVGTLSSVDPEGGAVTFSVNQDGFEVVGDELRTTGPLDHEETPTLTVAVTAEDATGHSTTTDLTVTVGDVNEAPTAIHGAGLTVAEQTAAGTLAGTLTATDPDAGDTVTLSLPAGEADNADFVLAGDELRTTRSFDVDVDAARTVRVLATDEGGLTLAVDLTVTVDDVNEAPGAPSLSASSVAENAAVGTVVGTLSAVDPDGNALTYSVTGDDFTLDGTQLRTAHPFDHETTPSITVHATAYDGQLGASADLTVTVTDVNETPTGVSLSHATVTENQPAGTVVGTLSALDPDSGETFTYAVDDTTHFAIQGDQLVTAAPFDFEQVATYPVRLTATDAGSLSVGRDTTVTVTDANDAPVAGADSYAGVLGNTPAVLGTSAVGGVPTVTLTGALPLANDTDQDGDPVLLQSVDSTSAEGGTVAMSADGGFQYVPPVGLRATSDTFGYTVTDGEATAIGTVTLSVGAVTWWVRAGAGGDGRAATPLGSTSSLNGPPASDVDAPNDRIYLFAGSHTGNLALEAGQILVGAGVALADPVVPAGTRPTLGAASGTVVALANGVTVDGVAISATGNADAVGGASLTTATVAAGASVSASGTGAGLRLSGTAGGDVTVAAPVSSSATGPVVSISQRSTGTVTFTGTVTSTGGGVSLGSGSAATSFEGGLALSTGSRPGLAATGAGTLVVKASATPNTLSATTGVPLSVTDTTIGAAGLAFRSVSSAGAADGIVLRNTGTSGSLAVTGTTPTGCAASAPACSGGTITGSTGAGIVLDRTRAPTLTRMRVTAGSGDGVQATTVSGLTLSDVMVDHNAGDGVQVLVPSGTTTQAVVTGSRLADNGGDQVQLSSSGGALTAVVRDNDLASATGGTTAATGIVVSAAGSSWAGSVQFDVAGNRVSGQSGPGILVSEAGGTTGSAFSGRVQNNQVGLAGSVGSCGSTGILVTNDGGSASLTVGVTANTVTRCLDRGIALLTGDGTGGLQATVASNTVQPLGEASTAGLLAQLGYSAADGGSSCLSLVANTVANSQTFQGIRVRPLYGQLATPDVAVPAPAVADVRSAWTSSNPATSTVTVDSPVTGTFASTASCTTPVTVP